MKEFQLTDELRSYVPQILNQAQNGIVITDPTKEDNPLIYANENFLKTFEYEAEDIIGKNLRFLQGNERDQPERDRLRESIKKEEAIRILIRNYTKYGKLVYVDLTISPIFDEENKLKFFLGVQKDKTNEYLLTQQSKQKSLSTLLSNISHQWRQPLSMVSVCASTLLAKDEIDQLTKEELQEKLESIINTINNLSHTIDLFTNFHADNDKLIDTSIQDELDKVIMMTKDTLQYNNIELILDIDYSKKVNFHMNSLKLIEVFMHMIQNSREALLQNKIEHPWIKITLQNKRENIQIMIEDNGQGINSKIIKNIFEPYFTTKHQYVGVGMGLHIVYRTITERFNGKVYVNNNSNGAVFTIELPYPSID